MLRLLYRIIRKCLVLDVTRLLCVVFEEIPGLTSPEADYEFRFADRKTLESVADRKKVGLNDELLERLDDVQLPQNYCGALFHNDRLVSYAWFAVDRIEARHNRVSDHPNSGVSVAIAASDLFIYAAFTHPEYRGQNLFPTLLKCASKEFEKRGFRRFVSTTEWTNTAARCAFKKAGFADLGMIWKSSVGTHSLTNGPKAAERYSIYVGKPVGGLA